MADSAARLSQLLPAVDAPLERRYGVLGASLVFQTNDELLLAAADASFGRFALPAATDDPIVVRLVSEPDRSAYAPDEFVHRISGHHYVIDGPSGVATVDAEAGVGFGFVSRSLASDQAVVRYLFIEAMALSMLTHRPAYLSLHAAGVARDGAGLILQGPAGSGKSTLALACARRGLDVFAEDSVFVRRGRSGLEAWGLPWRQRMLPDASRLFPELGTLEARRQVNGELKLELDLDVSYPGRAVPCSIPRAVLRLERAAGERTRLEPLTADEGRAQIEINYPWQDGWSAEHEATADLLFSCSAYRLVSGGRPEEAVEVVEDLLDRR